MISILIDQFPTAVMIGDQEIPINSDFRTGIRIILAFEDNDLAGFEKQSVLLQNLYPKPIENEFIEEAVKQGIKFLNCGKVVSEDEDNEDLPRLYSFDQDAELIFAAFKQTHGIDLDEAQLHWWKFMTLFMDLGADTAFCNLIGLRHRLKTGKATKEERQFARDHEKLVELPEIDMRTLEEKEKAAEFLRLVKGNK